MKKLAFIPVRGGSKSIPLKNIKSFCGKPLVYWVIKAAVDSGKFSKIIIATDDHRIIEVVDSLGFDNVSVYIRNKENSRDDSSTESVMIEYINNESISLETTFVLIQATSPLLTGLDLIKGFSALNDHDSVLSCVRTKRFFWSEKGEALNYNFHNRPRRQDFDGLLMENGAFYINSVSNILKHKNRLSGNIGVSEMAEFTAVEIDEEEDWIVAESLMNKFILKTNEISKKKIKLFVTDVDGVLTDAGMYYSESGDEFKKFNTHDGMAFQLLREQGIKTAIITSENTMIVANRAKKLKVDFLYQGKKHGGKLNAVLDICSKENIHINEVAYIGDDINCFELLCEVGLAACPSNAVAKIKQIPNIIVLEKKGGEGVVREFYNELIKNT